MALRVIVSAPPTGQRYRAATQRWPSYCSGFLLSLAIVLLPLWTVGPDDLPFLVLLTLMFNLFVLLLLVVVLFLVVFILFLVFLVFVFFMLALLQERGVLVLRLVLIVLLLVLLF